MSGIELIAKWAELPPPWFTSQHVWMKGSSAAESSVPLVKSLKNGGDFTIRSLENVCISTPLLTEHLFKGLLSLFKHQLFCTV